MEKLIRRVRENPILYNTNHPDYLMHNLKKIAWDKIAKELNYENGDVPRDIWKKLRNSHRDALRRKEVRIEGGYPPEAKAWKYETHMSFLLKFMVGQNPNASRYIRKGIQKRQDFKKEESEVRNFEHIQSGNSLSSECNSELDTISWPKSLHTTVTVEKVETEEESNDMAIRKDTHNSSNRENARESDELYNFYMSMYNVTRSLPLTRQIKLKRLIFNAVTEEQEQEMLSCTTITKQEYELICEDPIEIYDEEINEGVHEVQSGIL